MNIARSYLILCPPNLMDEKLKKKRIVQRIDFPSLKYIFCIKQAAGLCSNKHHYLSLNACSLITFSSDYLDTIRNKTFIIFVGVSSTRYDAWTIYKLVNLFSNPIFRTKIISLMAVYCSALLIVTANQTICFACAIHKMF